jgi:hypothetical protein
MTASTFNTMHKLGPEPAPDSLREVSLYVDPRVLTPFYSLKYDPLIDESDYVRQILDSAERAGATIQQNAHMSDSDDAYMFALVGAGSPTQHERDAMNDVGIRMPHTQPLQDLLDGNVMNTPPVVVANNQRDGGTEKYLIETPEQLEVMSRFGSSLRPGSRQDYEVREFIETPSNHYTSYRVLVDGAGNVLASGLLYSQATKSYPLRNAPMRSLRSELSHNGNGTFTWFTDIRSNLSTGGRVIPLMGEYAQGAKNHNQAEILKAHGIDPTNPKTPEDVLGQASIVGELACRRAGLVIGVDFLADANQNNEPVFLEYNGWPGAQTYHACHNQEEPYSLTKYRPLLFSIGLALLAKRRNK